MELHLAIKSGQRRGQRYTLLDTSLPLVGDMLMVLEDEIIEFELTVSNQYRSAKLELYNHSISASMVKYPDNQPDHVTFVWSPDVGEYSAKQRLFWNYFGLAELNILLLDEQGSPLEMVEFEAIQVVATKSSAENVEMMFEYLAGVSPEELHSVFSATRHSVGFEEGMVSPDYTFERVEHALEILSELIPQIVQSPLTRLVPEQQLTPVTGREELDDSSISWLLENLAVLEPTDRTDESHLIFEGEYYKANSMMLPVLQEQSDLYENWVIHGFVELLLHTTQGLNHRMESELGKRVHNESIPVGYVSFFQKITQFKAQLMSSKLHRIDRMITNLKHFKALLDSQLPVKRSIHHRPIITPKAIKKPAYRDLFVEVVKWHEKGQVDWSAYQNLFAIDSIPALFEAYCYFRVLESVNNYFDKEASDSARSANRSLSTTLTDQLDNKIEVVREPEYWTVEHVNKDSEGIVNSEGYTLWGGKLKVRGQRGNLSNRKPDIVVKIHRYDGVIKLIILDAKYTRAHKAFTEYLPELTMKYVHGLHRLEQSEPLVSSMSILFPEDQGLLRDYHYGKLALFGEQPVTPALICCGIILGNHRAEDQLDKLIRKALELEKVKPVTMRLAS